MRAPQRNGSFFYSFWLAGPSGPLDIVHPVHVNAARLSRTNLPKSSPCLMLLFVCCLFFYLVNVKSTNIINVFMLSNDPRSEMCSSVVRAFAHGAMGRRIDPSWGRPIELFLVPASASRLV